MAMPYTYNKFDILAALCYHAFIRVPVLAAVGLVNSGIMKLSQTVGLILGANLGTTATAWLFSLNGIQADSPIMVMLKPATFMPFVAIVGVAMYIYSRIRIAKSSWEVS